MGCIWHDQLATNVTAQHLARSTGQLVPGLSTRVRFVHVLQPIKRILFIDDHDSERSYCEFERAPDSDKIASTCTVTAARTLVSADPDRSGVP